jgi:nitrite reductase/ring-hydroxylating ferredoxin subunit
LADVESAGAVIVDGPSGAVILAAADGTVVGHSAVCTHQGCTINKVDGTKVACPCHGSQFNWADGSVAHAPATKPLKELKVKIVGTDIVLES